jgi:hypothetical protein
MKPMTDEEARHLLSKTEEVEAAKWAKQAEREERHLEKARKQRQLILEKLVAPGLLLLTIVVSLLLFSLY